MSDLPLHVDTLGAEEEDAESFVLLHGYGGSSFSWRYWAPALARRGRVLLVDLKGFGAAPRPDDGRYSPLDQAELVHRLIVERDLRRVTLVGHSLGGGVALAVGLRLLDDGAGRLRRLVLVAGAAYKQRMPPFVGLARHRRFATLVMALLGTRLVVRWVLRTMIHDPTRITRDQVTGYAKPLRGAAARRVLVETALQIVPPGLKQITERYPELDVPTLLLWGDHDRVVPLHVGQRLAKNLPQARLTVLPACGHLPAEELPELSLGVLQGFLDEGEGREAQSP